MFSIKKNQKSYYKKKIANFVIPITKTYWLTIIWFLIQGIATAGYDLGGNHIVLGLWKGISTSPINAMVI